MTTSWRQALIMNWPSVEWLTMGQKGKRGITSCQGTQQQPSTTMPQTQACEKTLSTKHFFHKSSEEQRTQGCHAVWKYPHVQPKSRAEPVGFPDLLIISIYSHPAYCGHVRLHLMIPHLGMEIGAFCPVYTKTGFSENAKIFSRTPFSLKPHRPTLHIIKNISSGLVALRTSPCPASCKHQNQNRSFLEMMVLQL